MANAANGDVYDLGGDLLGDHPQLGDQLRDAVEVRKVDDAAIRDLLDQRRQVAAKVEELGREMTDDERRADEALRRGDPIVLVDGSVAQQLRLGARELDRRRRRRR